MAEALQTLHLLGTHINQFSAALEELRKSNSQAHEVFLCKNIMGLTDKEIVEKLGISKRTINRKNLIAKARLRRSLEGETE